MVAKIFSTFICVFLSFEIALSQKNDSIDNFTITVIGESPVFKGNLSDFIQKSIVYPRNALQDSIEGSVIIEYWINIDGSTCDHKVIRSVRKDVDDEALRVTKLIKYEKPASQKGIPIKMRFTIPVIFKFEDNTLYFKSKNSSSTDVIK